jgi:hypothetical protein
MHAVHVLSVTARTCTQAYDSRPLFMRDLRAHVTTTLRAQGLGPGGQGYAIVDERIVQGAGARTFITLLAEARAHVRLQGQGGAVGWPERNAAGDDGDDEGAFRGLLLGQHLGRRARHDAATSTLFKAYLEHHYHWLAQLKEERRSGDPLDNTTRALMAIEQELAGLETRL